jgi:hypothetical protein
MVDKGFRDGAMNLDQPSKMLPNRHDGTFMAAVLNHPVLVMRVAEVGVDPGLCSRGFLRAAIDQASDHQRSEKEEKGMAPE